MAQKSNRPGWKIWAAAAAAGAFSFFAVIALAQTTGGSSGSSGSTSGGGHSHGSGVGVGISVDLSKMFSDSHETRPANEWNTNKTTSGEGGGQQIIYFNPNAPQGKPSGVDVRIDNSGHVTGGDWVVNWKPSAGATPVTPVTPFTAAGTPCPPKENTDQIKAENADLKKQIDALKAENDQLRTAAGEAQVCKEKQKDCEKKLAAAQAQITSLQNQLSTAQAKAAQPGDGAKAIYVPFSVTYNNGDEIIHSGWDVIGAVFEGNGLRVENHTEDWIKKHGETSPEYIAWLRNGYGRVPEGHIDFGNTLFEGETLRDRIEHLCDPPPTLEELKASNGSVAHELSVHYNKSTQKVTASSNGKDVAVTNQQISENAFDLDLSAECHWYLDGNTVKKQVTIQLAVQYQDADGKTHEVKYEADNPQMGWIMKG